MDMEVNDGVRLHHQNYTWPCLPLGGSLEYGRITDGRSAVEGVSFERLKGEGHHYPVLLHIGSTYVPVTENTVSELKACALLPGERFLEILIDKVGYSDYLKDRIRAELKKTGDPVTQATVLQGVIRDL